MKNMIRYAGLLALVAAAQFTFAEDTVQILRTGLWHGDEITAESGPAWWGIFPEGDGFTLQSAPVTITIEHDAVVDEEGQATGKMVKVPQEAEPVLLVRGLPNAREGRLDTVPIEKGDNFLLPSQSLRLSMGKEKRKSDVQLLAVGKAVEMNHAAAALIHDYRFLLYSGDEPNVHIQELARVEPFAMDGTPRIVWAGDIDRDGKIDLLLDTTYHYNLTRLVLYLSSAAKEGEIVGKVAEWKTMGC